MGFNWRDWPLALGRLQPMAQRPKVQYTILYSVSKILLYRDRARNLSYCILLGVAQTYGMNRPVHFNSFAYLWYDTNGMILLVLCK